MNEYSREFTAQQFDSICNWDSLPTTWNLVPLRDVETNKPIERYMYIKDSTTVYTLTKEDGKFIVTKRITP